MTTTSNINGVTKKQITTMMLRLEKLINWYNKKYNFDLSFATEKEIKEYEGALRNWDFLKNKKDSL